MNPRNNTVLITGGATGIGFALAESFRKLGNEVIICGRRENLLKEAEKKIEGIHTLRCDVSKPKECELLCEWVSTNFKSINILVNNAGIQKMINLNRGLGDFDMGEDEIDINLKAPIYLSANFIPVFMRQKEAAIVNVSSGLGFVPMSFAPVYCATKAALHSFSLSLRHQLRNTSIKVFELIPPTVDTELDRGTREKRGLEHRGIPAQEVADNFLKAFENNEYEIAVGMAEKLKNGSKEEQEQLFRNMNP